jgi:uncharacterized protein involved in outer membrane biogenesis
MKKSIKIIAIGVVVVVIASLAIAFLLLNSIVRMEVEQQASASLNVTTTLGGAAISVFGGSVGLSDLDVGSPPNYTAANTLTLGGASVAVKYSQLRTNPIHISNITITSPVIYIEQKDLKLNLQALMDQIPQTPKTGSGEAKPAMKLIIDEIDLTGALVNFMPGLPGMSSNIAIPIPSLTLKNIGNADGNQNGAAIKEVVMQVCTALAAKAGDSSQLPPELKALLSTNLSDLSNQLGGEFNKQLQGISSSIGKQIPADLGNLINNKGGGDAGKQVGQELQGLFGGQKKQPGQ